MRMAKYFPVSYERKSQKSKIICDSVSLTYHVMIQDGAYTEFKTKHRILDAGGLSLRKSLGVTRLLAGEMVKVVEVDVLFAVTKS